MSTVARQLVSIRSCSWIVTEVALGTLLPERSKIGLETPQHLLTLSSIEDRSVGEEPKLIWETESEAKATENEGGIRLCPAGRVGAPECAGFVHRLSEKAGALVIGGIGWGMSGIGLTRGRGSLGLNRLAMPSSVRPTGTECAPVSIHWSPS